MRVVAALLKTGSPLYPFGRAGAIAASFTVHRLVPTSYFIVRPELPELSDPYVLYSVLT